jgi:lactate permease
MDAALAAGPLLAALLCLLVLRRSAGVAGGIACALALALVLVHGSFALPADQVGLAMLRGMLVTLLVTYIVFFGLLLYHLMARGRAMDRLVHELSTLGGDRAARTLVLCLPLGAFFESASGFGVGIVIVAPLLLALGYSPWRAALLALLTQNAVPWGALSVGTILGAELGGLSSTELGLGSAYLSTGLFPYFAILALLLEGGIPALRANLGLASVVSGLMALVAWAGSLLLGVELAMVVGGALVAGIALIWLRRRAAPRTAPIEANGADGLPALTRALVPYAVLVTTLLGSRLIEPVRVWLVSHVVLSVPAVPFSLPLLYSPAFWLAMSCAAAIPVLRLDRSATLQELGRTVSRWRPATVALAAFLVLSELMLQSGMTEHLASATASLLGPAYILAAPAVGGLGGFLTGSNAAGNAMFMGFQLRMAEQLHLPPLLLAAIQNTAGAALSLASPQRIVLVTAVVGLSGKEGELMRVALLIGLGVIVLVAVSGLTWLSVPSWIGTDAVYSGANSVTVSVPT